eukprot:618361-Amphidinium_carterae.1
MRALGGLNRNVCGFPLGCGLAVDFLHAFLVRTLRSAGRQVEVRKHVDDMVLVAAGPYILCTLPVTTRHYL